MTAPPNAANALLRDEGARAALPCEHEATSAVAAIEEFLRIEGPAKIMMPRAVQTHECGGQQIRAGQQIFLAIGAANRGPAVFANPDKLDRARAPNPHVAFGEGIHFCLGAPHARLEARIALTRLFAHFPRLALACEEVAWRATISDRSLATLSVTI